MKIMIVEDDKDVSKTLEFLLVRGGHEVAAIAGDGFQAVEMYQEIRPDLVIMDIILPKEHGINAIKAIVDMDPEAKVIAVTGAVNKSLITRALDAGASGYVTKPFGARELLKCIERVS